MSFSNEQFMGSIKKNPISIGCALLAIALVGVAYFRSGKAGELETELEQKSADAGKYAANLKNAAQLQEQFDALVAAQKAIEARMIRAEELTTNRQYFYKLEADTGVKLLDLRPTPNSKSASKAGYQPIPFALNIQGDYRQILTFLRMLESGPRYCRVLSASCNSPAERGPVLGLSLNLELLGFL
jgi:Tfp pilus assembly protein PilO